MRPNTHRPRVASLLIGALALSSLLAACAAPQHLHVIEPIKYPASGGSSPGKNEAPPKERPDVGNWFVRKVYEPDQGKKRLYALEILYCPTDKPVYNECRIAVAWSRNGSGGLGPQVGAPPSPVEPARPRARRAAEVSRTDEAGEPERAPARAATGEAGRAAEASSEPEVGARSAAPPAAAEAGEGEPNGVDTRGRDFLELPSSDVTRLRGWVNQAVVVQLSYGDAGGARSSKSVRGTLSAVGPSGLSLERGGKTGNYKWDEVVTVAPAAASR